MRFHLPTCDLATEGTSGVCKMGWVREKVKSLTQERAHREALEIRKGGIYLQYPQTVPWG